MIPPNQLLDRLQAAQHAAERFKRAVNGNARPSLQLRLATKFIEKGRPDMATAPIEAAEREMRRTELFPYVMRLPDHLFNNAMTFFREGNYDALEALIIQQGLLG